MADRTKIQWSNATWNPVTGCFIKSAGCANCYAMRLAGTRMKNHASRTGLTVDSKAGPVWNGQVRFNHDWLTQPLHWKRPRKIFTVAHGDLFFEAVPDDWIDRVFAVAAVTPHHTYQMLTKRVDRMGRYISHPARTAAVGETIINEAALQKASRYDPVKWEDPMDAAEVDPWPLPNVWLGASLESRATLFRIDELREVPAAKRFLSIEPLLEDLGTINLTGIDWVIVGGESGPNARPVHPDWVRSIRDQCIAAGVKFFFKQWGAWVPLIDRDRDDSGWRADYRGASDDPKNFRILNLAGGHGFHGERVHLLRRMDKTEELPALDGRTWGEMAA